MGTGRIYQKQRRMDAKVQLDISARKISRKGIVVPIVQGREVTTIPLFKMF